MEQIAPIGQKAPIFAAQDTDLQKIKTEVVLGSPRESCNGAGICRVIPFGSDFGPRKCPKITAWIHISFDKRIRIWFCATSIDVNTDRRYFYGHFFRVADTFLMPEFVLLELGIAEKVVIRPGLYPVSRSTRYLIVDF